MRSKHYFFIACLLTATGLTRTLHGQDQQIIPVSPEAAALAKEVNYPVNYNTGVPDINIPFYTIKVGGMELPINFDYHAGGFRINEQATRVGLGWSLSADIQISRSINGLDDFTPSTGYIGNTLMKNYDPYACSSCLYPLWSASPWPYANAYDLATGAKDGMPDKFNYRLLNKSGSFYFLKSSTGTGYTIVPVPYNNIRITYNNGQFIIVDTDGTVYYFGEQGAGGDVSSILAQDKEVSGTMGLDGGCTSCHVTTWKCKQIENNTGTDQITFTYTPKAIATYRTYNDYIELYNNPEPCGLDVYHTSDQQIMTQYHTYEDLTAHIPFYSISSPKYLEVFGNGPKAVFHVPYLNSQLNFVDYTFEKDNYASTASQRVAGLSLSEINFRGGKVQFNGADQLSSITIKDDKNAEVKSVYLFQSYANAIYTNEAKTYNGDNFIGTRYLDSLHVQNGSTTYERYALLYKDKFCFGNHLKGHDAWGYPNLSTVEIAAANNTFGNLQTVPKKSITQARYYRDIAGCQNPATDIPLSFGGDTWAEAPNEEKMQHGILKRIIYPTGGFVDFDFESNKYLQKFSNEWEFLQLPQLSGGLRIRSINYYNDGNANLPQTQKYYRYGDLEDGTGQLAVSPHLPLEPYLYHLDAVSYTQQIAYLKGPSSSCSNRGCLSVLAVESKTTYHPASYLDYTYGSGAPIYYTKVTEYNQDLGTKTGKTVYEYYPPEEFHDAYNPLITESNIEGTNIPYLKTDGLEGAQKSISTYKFDPNTGYHLLHQKEFEYSRFLTSEQVHVAYAFLKVEYQVVQGSFSGTNRDLYNRTYSFPYTPPDIDEDYIAGEYGIPVGKLLLTRETDDSFEDSGYVLTNTTDYYYDNPTYLQPSRIVTTDSRNRIFTKSLKYSYDFDGIHDQMEAKNMVSQVIEEFLINNAINQEVYRKRTNYDQISAGAGFIAPVSLQSSTGGQPFVTDVTFDKYDQYGNILQQTARDGIPISYLWGYGGLYPVAELKGVKYSEIPASFVSNTQILNPTDDNSLRTVLTNLRNSFSGNKQISTYTYKRSVGMTSHTSPNGYTSYYEYDPLGRMIAEKDYNQRLIKAYDYHTQEFSPLSLTSFYVNIPMMQTETYPCDLEPTDLYQIRNNFVPGGWYSNYTMEGANSNAENDLPFSPPEVLPPCDSNTASINLLGIYNTLYGYPERVDIDFIKDGHIVATQKCPFNQSYQGAPPPVSVNLHLPEGEYQVSIRPSAATHYHDTFLIYSFTAVEDNYYPHLQQGATITLEKGKHYEIMVNNIM
ncbi:hypothetical protein [Compostibacter hankyongensis]|uniref:RHS repeat protein n=1 Tax=Compostibacter hankyongensis TaxID=1007089 RepID=A0ABP8FZR4_9BACT